MTAVTTRLVPVNLLKKKLEVENRPLAFQKQTTGGAERCRRRTSATSGVGAQPGEQGLREDMYRNEGSEGEEGNRGPETVTLLAVVKLPQGVAPCDIHLYPVLPS